MAKRKQKLSPYKPTLPALPEDSEIEFRADPEEVELVMIALMNTVNERTQRASYIHSLSDQKLQEIGFKKVKNYVANLKKLDSHIQELQGWLNEASVFPETYALSREPGFQSAFMESLRFKPFYAQDKYTLSRARALSK